MFDLSTFKLPQLDSVIIQKILTADYPAAVWYVPSLVLVVLAITAVVDARTGRVPTLPLILALIGAVFSLVFFGGWMVAFERAYPVLIPVVILWSINSACVKLTRHDAFGMGDIKWSIVAAFTFGAWPLFWTWIIGAWFALMWLFVRWGVRKVSTCLGSDHYQGHAYVHFVPFLFLGLCVALLLRLQAP